MSLPEQLPHPSYWQKDQCFSIGTIPQESQLPTKTNVVIIGGGLTGCSAAYWLNKLGIDCVIIEARSLAGGATGRNGGHLRASLADSEAGEFERRSAAELLSFLSSERIDCGINHGGSVRLFDGHPDLVAEATKNPQLKVWSRHECEAVMQSNHAGGMFASHAIQLWPSKVVEGIASKTSPSLCKFVCHTRADYIENRDDSDEPYSVKTSKGNIICRSVIVATNAWASQLLPELKTVLSPARNQVVVTKPVSQVRVNCAFSQGAGAAQFYGQQLPNGRLIVGGGRVFARNSALGESDDSVLEASVSAALRNFVSQFPWMEGVEVESEWSGVIGVTSDGRPLVGEMPGRPGVLVGVGYCGHGMPYGFSVGRHLSELVAGRPISDPYLTSLHPSRLLSLPSSSL